MSLHISLFVSLSQPPKHTCSLTPYQSVSLSLPPPLNLSLIPSLHFPYISLNPFVSRYQTQNIHALSPIYLSLPPPLPPPLSLFPFSPSPLLLPLFPFVVLSPFLCIFLITPSLSLSPPLSFYFFCFICISLFSYLPFKKRFCCFDSICF